MIQDMADSVIADTSLDALSRYLLLREHGSPPGTQSETKVSPPAPAEIIAVGLAALFTLALLVALTIVLDRSIKKAREKIRSRPKSKVPEEAQTIVAAWWKKKVRAAREVLQETDRTIRKTPK